MKHTLESIFSILLNFKKKIGNRSEWEYTHVHSKNQALNPATVVRLDVFNPATVVTLATNKNLQKFC